MTGKTFIAALALTAGLVTPAQAQGPEFASELSFSPFMVAISVDDIEAETAFYVEVLDFTVEKDASMRDGAVQFRWLTNGTQRIELVKAAGSTAGTPHPAPPGHAAVRGFTHLTLQTDDIAAVRAVLATRGITPSMEPTDVVALGIRVMYLTDPEGNAVEIAQVVGG
jgi:catechol 2,3-dioxygenase-like lactoylglutathione lyase family enzyme